MAVIVREPAQPDREQWESLWSGYLDFYRSPEDPESTQHLWDRLLDSADRVQCHVAEEDGRLIGIVHFFPHEDTWRAVPTCYLQDLYVRSDARGSGVGRLLIESVVEVARAEGWSAVYWLTAADNERGRVLYDKVTGGASGFIHYEIEV